MYDADISLYHMFGGSIAVLGLGALVSGQWLTGLIMMVLGVGLFLYGSATAPRPDPEDSPLNRPLGQDRDEDDEAAGAD